MNIFKSIYNHIHSIFSSFGIAGNILAIIIAILLLPLLLILIISVKALKFLKIFILEMNFYSSLMAASIQGAYDKFNYWRILIWNGISLLYEKWLFNNKDFTIEKKSKPELSLLESIILFIISLLGYLVALACFAIVLIQIVIFILFLLSEVNIIDLRDEIANSEFLINKIYLLLTDNNIYKVWYYKALLLITTLILLLFRFWRLRMDSIKLKFADIFNYDSTFWNGHDDIHNDEENTE